MGHSIEKNCGFEQDNFLFRYRAAAIIIENDCVMMAHNDIDDYYYSVGGGVHLGETSEEAVIREVKEETGVSYEVERLAFVNESLFYGHGTADGKECHIIEFYYLMKPKNSRIVQDGSSNGMTAGTTEYIHWLPIRELKNYKIFPEFFREKLLELPEQIEHFVSDERRS